MTVRDAGMLAHTAASQWGSDAVRLERLNGSANGSVNGSDGKLPETLVLEPDTPAAAAAILRWASAERLTMLPSGGGTKLRVRTPHGSPPVDAVLSTRRLNTPIDHRAGDLTATLPAGATLAAVNASLGRERQWLPLDPAHAAHATIGGIVAAGDSGPRRHRYGAPRDLIIGIELALADGRLVKAGGHVVKNVAGYDLSRLMCGSYGSLALITSATFKLFPIAPASRTVVAALPDSCALRDLIQALTEAPLTPSTCEIESPPLRLLMRFETTERAAEHQASAAAALAERHGATTMMLSAKAEDEAWRDCESTLWDREGTLVKIAVLPTDVGVMLAHIDRVCLSRALEYRAGGRAALGVIIVRLSGHIDAHSGIVSEVRKEAVARRGSVVVLSAPPPVGDLVDWWGDIGDALPTMRAIKVRFDPHNILSPGRGPGGL